MSMILKSLEINSCYSKKSSYLARELFAEQLIIREKIISLNLNSVLTSSSREFVQPVIVALIFNGKVYPLSNPMEFLIVYINFFFINRNLISHSSFSTFVVFLYINFLSKQYNVKYDFYTLLLHKSALYQLYRELYKKSPFTIFLKRFLDLFFSLYIPALSFIFPIQVQNYLKTNFTNTQVLDVDSAWVSKNISFDKFLYKFINKLTKKGKKSVAMSHFFDLIYLHKIYNLFYNKNYILGDIISIISPKFKLVSLKYRGRNRLIPKLVNTDRMIFLGISLFLQAVRIRPEKGIVVKMYKELLDIYKLQGNSLKLKDANYKSGIANRSLLFRRPANWRIRKLYTLSKEAYYLG